MFLQTYVQLLKRDLIELHSFFFLYFFYYSLLLNGSIDDYIYSDIGLTSNINGEVGLINIPSSRILDEGNLKLHLSNSEPINSLFITAYPFDWMEVSLRYTDINTLKYSPFPSFSGNQSFKDKSFNLKLKLIEEFESPFEFQWNNTNDNEDISYNDDIKVKRDRWIESLKKDIYVNEAMNLLRELSSIKSNEILSQINID